MIALAQTKISYLKIDIIKFVIFGEFFNGIFIDKIEKFIIIFIFGLNLGGEGLGQLSPMTPPLHAPARIGIWDIIYGID